MANTIESRLKGSPRSHFFGEFFTNSAYFPLVNIVFERLLNGPADYLIEPAPYTRPGAGLVD